MNNEIQKDTIGLVPKIPVLCDNLALLGDIGYPQLDVYRDFVLLQASRFRRVFVIAGNHEYYKSSLHEVDGLISSLAASRTNIYFLNRSCCEFEEEDGEIFRVLGATLWTRIPNEYAEKIGRCVNDYRYIRVVEPDPSSTFSSTASTSTELFPLEHAGRPLTVNDTNRMHEEDVAFLAAEIRKAQRDSAKVVIFTHHAPTAQNSALAKVDVHKTEDMSFLHYMEYTDLEYLMEPHVLLWGYGHTHYSSRQQINQTLVVSNQLGYVHPVLDHFDPNFKLDLVINARSYNLRKPEDYLPCKPAGANVPRHMSKRNEEAYIEAGVLVRKISAEKKTERRLGFIIAGSLLLIAVLIVVLAVFLR